jgi:uncharacterized membrane protein YoaK (UPF0700 family)
VRAKGEAVIRAATRVKLLAAGLAALAGFVDATGFIKLGGFFVSFMSGNTTRLAVGLATNASAALEAAGLIGGFVLGVMLGTLVGRLTKKQRASRLLLLVAGLLALAAALNDAGISTAAIAAMVLAMGAENTVFEREGEVHIGLTYMTGTLVKFGQRLAGALMGGDRNAWQPYLLLWLGLAGGAVVGALDYPYLGLDNLWIAALAALAFAALAARLQASGNLE